MALNYEKELVKIKKLFEKSNTLKYEEIVKGLGWSVKLKGTNKDILERMIEEGELAKNNRGKYSLPERQGFVKGEFNLIKDRFAFVDTADEGIFIPRVHFNSALDGDTVLIKIKPGKFDSSKKEGEVVKVLKRNKDSIVGTLQRRDNFGFVIPNHSFGKDIYIPRESMKNIPDGKLVVVKITFWGDNDRKPEGKIVEVLGDPDNTDDLLEALIRRFEMSEEFPDEAIAEARNIPLVISEKELQNRKDYRKLKVITIDGDDAKDLDDAVYVEKLENGGYKLVVAIADVGHYIPVGSALDKEARKRGNSVYMVDRVLPMFPKEISNGICSLNPHEDKLTFSCEIIFDSNGKVLMTDIYKSVINTVHRMTYSNVNKILAKDIETCEKYSDILEEVSVMKELSALIRSIKYKRGSIDFDIPETKVVLDDENKVKEIKKYERGESERIIEDFMIAANEALAEKIFWLEVPSIYRTHDKPDPERIANLNEILSKFNYRIHAVEDVHPKRFQQIIEDSKERGISLIVHKNILMALKQARYTKENTGHFGLASSYYTHFTSPIRRYADLMIHRIAQLILTGYPTKKDLKWLNSELDEICSHISATEREAMKVEDESKKIKIIEYMEDKIGNEYMATVIGFNNKRVFFETEEFVECAWDVTMEKRDFYEFNEALFQMEGQNTKEVYKLGDKVKVILARVSMRELTIDVAPVFEEEK